MSIIWTAELVQRDNITSVLSGMNAMSSLEISREIPTTFGPITS